MAAYGTSQVRRTASERKAARNKAQGGKSATLPWVLFLLMGIPLGLMAALVPLGMAGTYIEPLRPLWRPWPSDLVKALIGAAIFCATLAFLAHRSGRLSGFHSGEVATHVALRNLAEGRGAAAVQESVPPPPPLVEVHPPAPEPPADSQDRARQPDEPPLEPAAPPGAA